jgi:outer membrane receptor protein involved in Fe transport
VIATFVVALHLAGTSAALAPPLAAAPVAAAQADDRSVQILVVDPQGLPVPGAELTLSAREGSTTRTAESRESEVRLTGLPAGAYTLRVEASGFASQTVDVDLSGETPAAVTVRLVPAGVREDLVVTPTRTEERIGQLPASVTVVSASEIQASPAVVADDVLRQVPTFSLFRRSSSLASHPTSQGVSLRGIGPSGVSRTLVMLDGIPFNDPFGGWVYWTRVPLMNVERIEVQDDTNSAVWGNYAEGGVINIVTAPATKRTVEIKPQYGNHNSPKLDVFGSDRWNDSLGGLVEGSFFDTEGYPVVAPSEAGAIDIPATVSYKNMSGKLDYTPSGQLSAFVRGGYFSEDRGNGKVQEVNDTQTKFVNGGIRMRTPDGSDLQAHLMFTNEHFHATFLAVPDTVPPRNTVRLTLEQHVPTNNVGGMVQWSKIVPGNHVLTAGADFNWVDGDSQETVYGNPNSPNPTTDRISGGTQRSAGVFLQDLFPISDQLRVTLSARLDHWSNYAGHNLETSIATGNPTAGNVPAYPDRSDTVVSPRMAALYRVTDRVSAWGSVAWGFRAPTLNELYRQFRVGSVLTLANSDLGPERLVGGEFGVNIAPTRDVTVRATWFDNRLKDPVSNVTISSTPSLITRERQNLGRTQIWGFQTDVEYRLQPQWTVSGAYAYDNATVDQNPSDPTLEGNLLPQVPKNRGSIQVMYTNPAFASIAVSTEFSGAQFDDDQNMFVLPKYGVVDLQVSRVVNQIDVFVGAQNLFNKQFIVGSNPTTIGNPRLINAGVRLRWNGK